MSAQTHRPQGFTLVELPVVSKRQRIAFTLVELLVVITIIGILVGLLLPAVQAARENARQITCLNRLTELGKGMIGYNTAKGKLPGYAQLVRRGRTDWVTAAVDVTTNEVIVISAASTTTPPTPPDEAWNVSWAAVLLPHIERQDIWDQMVDPNLLPPIRRVDLFLCPSDTEITSQVDLPALSYSANTGGWDWDDGGEFLFVDPTTGVGDTTDNGVLMNLAEYQRDGRKLPQARLEKIKDGTNMTFLLTENNNKDYEPTSIGLYFTWLGGDGIEVGTEQQLGVVWVVNENPQPGNALDDQERISRNEQGLVMFDPYIPRFARPGSNHNQGVNVVYCDGHGQFLREDIDYIVYQQLLTSNGRKCVDPLQWDPAPPAIVTFREAPPLSEADFD